MAFEYPMIEPPFEVIPFRNMSKEEAKRNFDWYTSLRDQRCELLRSAIETTSKDSSWFDYSRESLAPLLKWATPWFDLREQTPKEREKYSNSAPAWYQKVSAPPREFDDKTKTLIHDVGFYFAKIFMIRFPQVQWALCTRKTVLFNRPYLTGFRLQLDPTAPISASVRNVMNGGASPDELQTIYDRWKECLL